MSIDPITFSAKLPKDLPEGTMPPVRTVLDQWLANCFAPFELEGQADGVPLRIASLDRDSYHGSRLWHGEVLDEDAAFTRIDPRLALPVANLLPGMTSGDLYLKGGLRHILPGGSGEAEWFGRKPYGIHQSLYLLASVDFEWNEYSHEVSLSLWQNGYPLTNFLPEALRDRKPLIEENRALIVPAIAELADLLSYPRGSIDWEVSSEKAYEKRDQVYLDKLWDQLRASHS